MKIKTALVLCAGFGKRLNPLTSKTPKPLLKINNITMLENCINIAVKFGVKKIFLNTFHLHQQIHNFIKSKNFLQYKTLISQELLKDSILASNVIYFSTEHSKEDIERYLISLEKVFKLIAECEDGKDIKTLLNTPACYNSFERLN